MVSSARPSSSKLSDRGSPWPLKCSASQPTVSRDRSSVTVATALRKRTAVSLRASTALSSDTSPSRRLCTGGSAPKDPSGFR